MSISGRPKKERLRRAALTTLFFFCSWWVVACGATAPSPNPPAGSAAVDKPLADPSDPAKLAPGWAWYQGDSQLSAFKLDSGALTITAGPKTQQWGATNSAPYVAYDAEGDFAAQTKLDFETGRTAYWAGIGIMSADDPAQWVRLVPIKQNALGLVRNSGREITATTDFPLTDVYLKVQRRGGVISAYYSKDGATWQPVSEQYEFNLSNKAKVYLVALTLGNGISARFSEVKITPL
jgi:regulation of enolase protein 1 (concanavalin A-like superfamily)